MHVKHCNIAELESNPELSLIWISQTAAELKPQVDYKYKNSANINKSNLWE